MSGLARARALSSAATAVLLACVAVAGCGRKATPSPTPAPSATAGTTAPPSSASAPASAAASAEAPPAFGPWVRCYGGFRPTSTPVRDVTRLAILCGPPNGMRQHGDVVSGEVSEGAAPREHKTDVERGQCLRVFAVGDEGVRDLDVALVDARGEVVATDGIDDRWPIVQPDRAVCFADGGAVTIRVSARKGSGKYAAWAWLLPLRRAVKRPVACAPRIVIRCARRLPAPETEPP